MLEPYTNLKLVRNRECISLKGDEASKRRFYRDLLVAEVQENFLNMNLLAGLYKSFDLIAVKDIFVDVLEEYDYSIHESMFPMVILHAGTSIERMNCANYVNMDNGSQGLEDTIEYQISMTFSTVSQNASTSRSMTARWGCSPWSSWASGPPTIQVIL